VIHISLRNLILLRQLSRMAPRPIFDFSPLIKAVKSRPMLYDKTHEDYLNTLKKSEVWKEVTKETKIKGKPSIA
jgi:hypothetical protein